ncbi:hypothetical protein [Aggregatibacter actinomycetemcomitans]|uniref:hypothetical protein n=1 Tax=Aggregatibacter actinomycetemcomitans TaxID=714 RepID=UPI001E5373D7|nr:hypothetical protein [Aggregatibacter actinomycetemcomitans]
MKQIITTALLAIITGVMMLYAVALITLPAHADNTTDYCDKDMSEQISAEWESKAKAEWIAIGAGAWDKLETLRDNAIEFVARKQLENKVY